MTTWETLEEGWNLHLSEQELFDNPMPYYHELRAAAPVFDSPAGFWFVTDYVNTEAILREDGRGDDSPWTREGVGASLPPHLQGDGLLPKYYSGKMNFNEEQHDRVRKLMSPSFLPRSVESMREPARAYAHELIDDIEASGENKMDVVQDFGLAIPTRMILTMLGIDVEETAAMNYAADQIVYSFEPAAMTDTEWQGRIEGVIGERYQYLVDLAAERHANPTDDLFSHLVNGMHQDPPLISRDELVMNVIFLVVAGLETTANSIASGVHLFLKNPDQLEMLKADWDLLPGAIEEIMRIAPATRGSAPKWALRDIEMAGGTVVPKGAQIRTSTIAANRDPNEFEDPDRFDITRDLAGNRQLTFAPFSAFYCLGHALARIEMAESLKVIFERCPNLALADEEVHYKRSLQLHGPIELNVTW